MFPIMLVLCMLYRDICRIFIIGFPSVRNRLKSANVSVTGLYYAEISLFKRYVGCWSH